MILCRFSPDYFEADIDSSINLHVTSSRRDVVYHKFFFHGAASYRLNEKKVYIMLEFSLAVGGSGKFCKFPG